MAGHLNSKTLVISLTFLFMLVAFNNCAPFEVGLLSQSETSLAPGQDTGPGPGPGDSNGGDNGDPSQTGFIAPAYQPSQDIAEVRSATPHSVSNNVQTQRRSAYEALDKEKMTGSFSPNSIYETFNLFALSYFGAQAAPLTYRAMGSVLDFVPSGQWLHSSLNSAAISFQTTLPSVTYIEYGPTAAFGSSSTPSERYFYYHTHHLKGLSSNTTYYYRHVATDERGKVIVSKTKSFKTGVSGDVVLVPGSMAGPPYVLNQAGKTYVLTKDISAPNVAIQIDAPGITLDLNGYTVTYANKLINEKLNAGTLQTAGTGIWGRASSEYNGVKIVNGFIQEGYVGNKADVSSLGLHAIYLSAFRNIEIAGLSISYHGAQLHAVYLRHPDGKVNIHHNNFTDKGFEILNRHGSGGGRPINIVDTAANQKLVNAYEIHHNLVKRSRQNGLLQATKIYDNEIYIDSWSTNSFAIQPHSTVDTKAGTIENNKIFLTGYHAIALGWAHLDLNVRRNLIHMEGVRTMSRRYYESWGDMDSLNGLRITNYSPGGQVRENLRYSRNFIMGTARGGGLMRGTEFFSDYSIQNTVLEDTEIHLGSEDLNTEDVTPIVTQGSYGSRATHLPVYYNKNRLVSNVANVRFGDSYGKGNRHIFTSCTFEKTGNNPNYHTFVFDGGYDSQDHEVIDPVFVGGARFDDVYWKQTSVMSYYTVKYSLTIQGAANAPVTVYDKNGAVVFNDKIQSNGQVRVPLSYATIRPVEWTPSSTGGGVKNLGSHQKQLHTPHKVKVGGSEKSVTMDAQKTLMF